MHKSSSSYLYYYVLNVVSLLCTFFVIESDVEVKWMSAKALYDYKARSEHELTFKRGDVLQVIEKTPDGNWWDAFIQGRRGYIPVAFVETTGLLHDHNSKPACIKAACTKTYLLQ